LGLAVNNYSITLGLTAKSILRALVLGPVGRPDPIALGHVGLPDQTILGPTNPSFFSKAIGSWWEAGPKSIWSRWENGPKFSSKSYEVLVGSRT